MWVPSRMLTTVRLEDVNMDDPEQVCWLGFLAKMASNSMSSLWVDASKRIRCKEFKISIKRKFPSFAI